jgi:hypothetical protein
VGRKLDTRLTKMPYNYQVLSRIQDLIIHYGRENVQQEFQGDIGQEDEDLQRHVENLYGSYTLTVMNDSLEIMFPAKKEKVA